MNKKVITIGIIVVVAIVVITGGVFLYQVSKEKQVKKDAQTMEQAVGSSSVDPCADITTQSEFISKDACYNYIAQTTNNKELCEKISQKELKDNCYENVE